jgi:hypothetical protein
VTSFTFSIDELKSAPPEIRQWMLTRIEKELVAAVTGAVPTPPAHEPELAACTPEEAAQLLEVIHGDFATVQVFLELARETPSDGPDRRFHGFSIAEMMRHTRLNDSRLVQCLQAINLGFQRVRNDAEARLFGFDQANHVFIHEATHRSIRAVWAELVGMTAPATPVPAESPAPSTSGFLPPRVGP